MAIEITNPLSVLTKKGRSVPPRSNIHIVKVDTDDPEKDSVTLPWIPKSLDFDPMSKLVAMPSIGRNLPFYHYTGAEDSLEFIIDWFFTDDKSRTKALHSATKMESFSKSNGYDEVLPRLKIIWGGSNIFKNSIWLLEHAPYRLSNWVDHVWDFHKDEYVSFELLPQQIIQEVKFKKISSHNLTYQDIIFER